MFEFKFIDLFAGIGGTRKAFESIGGECVFSSEWDEFCKKTYEANFKQVPYGDITELKEVKKHIKPHDVLVAGFPCQPFSSIGKREGFQHSTQGTLFYDIVRVLKARKPSAFLLENVPGLLTHDNKKTFDTIKTVLREELKYEIFPKILDSADYGLPQRRKRLYIVGFRIKNKNPEPISFKFPAKSKKKVYINAFLEENVKGYSISKHLQKVYLFKKKDGRPETINKHTKVQVKTLVASYHKIQRLTGTFVEDGPTGLRLLTANECKAIMGFEKDFEIPVSRTQMYRQFGNSVTIPVVKKIAFALVKKMEELENGKN